MQMDLTCFPLTTNFTLAYSCINRVRTYSILFSVEGGGNKLFASSVEKNSVTHRLIVRNTTELRTGMDLDIKEENFTLFDQNVEVTVHV